MTIFGKERRKVVQAHRRRGSVLQTSQIISVVCIILIFALPLCLWGEEGSRNSYEKFADAVGETLYFLAWPTAEYERVTFGGFSFATGGADISFRLHGRSGFSGDHLWVDVILEVRNGEITNIRWGDNNAILAQPGTIMAAMGEALAQLNEEYSRGSQGSQPPGRQLSGSSGVSQGFGFYFANNCGKSVTLAIRYQEVTGQWQTDGWWSFAPGEGSYLFSGGKQLRSNSAVWYFYAEAADGSWSWAGDHPFTFNGRNLPMKVMNDKEGDSEWSVIYK